jgi:hypothetical protein
MKRLILWGVLPLILIQFIRMDVPATLSHDNQNEIDAPTEVMDILKRSCYDCHSNSLIYPWYSSVAPISWYTQNHVKEGRRVVNFSQWKSYDKERQLQVLKKIPKALLIRMPLPDYLWLHPQATLTPKDKKILTNWANSLHKRWE